MENFIEYAFVLCHGSVIEAQHLPRDLFDGEPKSGDQETRPLSSPLKQAEAITIMEALSKYGGNRRKTAHHLGINKTTLWRKMKKYGITYHPSDEALTH